MGFVVLIKYTNKEIIQLKYLLFIAVFFLSACSTPNVSKNVYFTNVMDIIALSEGNTPDGLKGTFQLPIKASGTQHRTTYLNTELDYRDRRNISVSLHPKVIRDFIAKFGAHPESYFINKTILVTGEAKRVKIYFVSNGKLTEKYYFQTHIQVDSLSQIKVV